MHDIRPYQIIRPVCMYKYLSFCLQYLIFIFVVYLLQWDLFMHSKSLNLSCGWTDSQWNQHSYNLSTLQMKHAQTIWRAGNITHCSPGKTVVSWYSCTGAFFKANFLWIFSTPICIPPKRVHYCPYGMAIHGNLRKVFWDKNISTFFSPQPTQLSFTKFNESNSL